MHHRDRAIDDDDNLEDDDEVAPTKSGKWPGYYRCDDLVPPVCDDDLTIHQGKVETLPGVWVRYWRYVPPPSSSDLKNRPHPLIVINGGPGLPHNIVRPLRSLACDGREVVFYDQAATGASSLYRHQRIPSELFHIEYYAETELVALIAELGYEQFHVLGSSWGTMVALQYAVSARRHPHHHKENQQDQQQQPEGTTTGLQSLILNAPIADNRRFIQYQWDPVGGSIGRLPLYLQQRLRLLNQTQNFQDTPEYEAISNVIMSSFNARLGVAVDCWAETLSAGLFPGDLTPLTGPTDFLWTGDTTASISNWTVLPDLHRVVVPVQLNYGEYDFVSPHLVADTAAQLSNVECHRVPRAGHSLALDSPEYVYPKMRDFLKRVETTPAARFRPDGVCPVYHSGSGVAMDGEHYAGSPTTTSSTMILTVALVATSMILAFVFALGFYLGKRHAIHAQRDARAGYEMVGESTKLYNNGGEEEET